jgi:uncharacterized LabA/DUF88 family protein
MDNPALFVDLPNFYSGLLRSGIGDEEVLRDYLLYWFDFDRLAKALTGEQCSTWVFYSGRGFGPSGDRIKDEYLTKFIQRINSLTGVTARDVNIPGEQREPISYKCECGREGRAEWESEKGIDASITVHLFDTMDTWHVAYLLSGDADFIPAVSSLRRRGRILTGAGFSSAAPGLVRECYDYIDLGKVFLQDDILAYELFGKGGLIEKWFKPPLLPGPEPTEGANTKLWWSPKQKFDSVTKSRIADKSVYLVYPEINGGGDLSSRKVEAHRIANMFPDQIRIQETMGGVRCICQFRQEAWKGIERRLKEFRKTLPYHIVSNNPGEESYLTRFDWVESDKKYVVRESE